MQYTDLTKKELQREYNRMARRYTGFVREPLQLDMAEEDPLLGKSESLRAARHFGHAASVFAISARIAALESLQGMLRA